MLPRHIAKIESSVDYPVVVCGDTTGFTHFFMRSFDDRDHVNEFIRLLYNQFFIYQEQVPCTLKLEGDGFFAIHSSPVPTNSALFAIVMKQAEQTYLAIKQIIHSLSLPRPAGFRIRIAGGRPAQRLLMKSNDPVSECQNANCGFRTISDSIGYSVHLAERMSGIAKDFPLMVCQAVFEATKDLNLFSFEPIKIERRIPDGVFKEDVLNLYAFKSYEGL